MKTASFIFCIVVNSIYCFAQKPNVDTSIFFKWPNVANPAISNDGKFALYSIQNQPAGSRTLKVHSIDSSWEIGVPGARTASFTDDSQKVIYLKPNDSLCFLTLGSTVVEYVLNCNSFKLFKCQGVDSCHVDPGFLHVDPPPVSAIRVRA